MVDRPTDRRGPVGVRVGRQGGGTLNAYAAWIGAALVVGLAAARRSTRLAWNRLIDLHLAAGVVALVIGRIGYVAANAEYFGEHPWDAFALLRVPGLHGLAAFVGAAAVALVMRDGRIPPPSLGEGDGAFRGFRRALIVGGRKFALDVGCACQRAVAPTICLVGAAAALGCIDAGCAVGREVFWTDPAPLWMLRVDWPDAFQIRNPRLPAQWFAAAWLAVCAAAAVRRPTAALIVAAAGGAAMTAAGLFAPS